MGTTTTAVLLVLTGSAAVLALAGCPRRGARQWACHGAGALAMVAMLVPALDPLGAAAWVALLAGTAAWTSIAVVRARLAGDAAACDAAGAREVAEAWLMCVLVLLMAGHGGAALPGPAGHHGHLGGTGLLPGAALAGLVGVWAAALAAAHRSGGAAAPVGAPAEAPVAAPVAGRGAAGRRARGWRRDAASAGSVLAVASMLGMVGAAALG